MRSLLEWKEPLLYAKQPKENQREPILHKKSHLTCMDNFIVILCLSEWKSILKVRRTCVQLSH